VPEIFDDGTFYDKWRNQQEKLKTFIIPDTNSLMNKNWLIEKIYKQLNSWRYIKSINCR
jgi:hypothetical protein